MQRLAAIWVNLRTSLWFTPSLIVLAGIAAAVGLSQAGQIYPALAQSSLPALFGFSAEGSRAMLSAIATSMITVAGVAFSITIVALSLASQQYSPRVLRHFMGDRGNQVVLGTFVGIFAYCLVLLPTIRGTDGGHVPALAVGFGVVLALVGVGCLVYFIHHVASAIQASAIVAAIAHETHQAIDAMFPETFGREAEPSPAGLDGLRWHPVPAPRSGFLQLLNEPSLLRCAAVHDLIVRMECRIGDYVLAGEPLISINRPDEKAGAAAASAFTIERYRTVDQDAAFGIRQLVDVALRALSPSLNDPTTAVLCLNYLADLLRHAASRQAESRYRRAEGNVRLIALRPDFDELVRLAFDQIGESAAGSRSVLERLLWALESVADAARSCDRRRAAIAESVRLVGGAVTRTIEDAQIRESLCARANRLVGRCMAGASSRD